METKIIDSVNTGFQVVLLKAYGNKPLRRYASVREDGAIMVKSEKSVQNMRTGGVDTDWIGWPLQDIFEFSESSYNHLIDLYNENRQNDLVGAWEGQTKWKIIATSQV